VPAIFRVTNHTLTPAGPAGQHGTAIPFNDGIWQFAEEKPLAKQLLQYLMDPTRLEQNCSATLTVNIPPVKASEPFQGARDPKTAMRKDYATTAHMIGWPAPSDRKAEQARAAWLIPNMFTYYATGKQSLEDAVGWGEGELQRIYKAKAEGRVGWVAAAPWMVRCRSCGSLHVAQVVRSKTMLSPLGIFESKCDHRASKNQGRAGLNSPAVRNGRQHARKRSPSTSSTTRSGQTYASAGQTVAVARLRAVSSRRRRGGGRRCRGCG
jgi:hypothetical protein